MNNDELDQAINTARELFRITGTNSEAGKKAREHLYALMDEQRRRALAKPCSHVESTE